MEPIKQYLNFDAAYQYYNEKLFGKRLPGCMITLQRHAGSNGYYHQGKFRDKETGSLSIDEIALNPDKFGRSEKRVFSTLVHEMTHQDQAHYGKASRNGYHNKEWAETMKRIGLIPSATGEPGGAQTGQNMTHYIKEGGLFDTLTDDLLQDKMINWESIDYGALVDYVQVGGYTPGEPVTLANIGKLEPGYTVSYMGNFYTVDTVDSDEGTALFTPQGTDLPIPGGATVTVLKTQDLVDRKKKDKGTYRCPECHCTVWGKYGLNIVCGDCDEPMHAVE